MPSVLSMLPPPYSAHRRQSPPPTYKPRTASGTILTSAQSITPRNRSLSLRSSKKDKATSPSESGGGGGGGMKHRFTFGSIRSTIQPELSKKLYRLIKSENYVINSHTSSGRERISIASQLSDWGLATGDDAISDLSDKLGVLMSEIGEQEIAYSQNLEDYRATLKTIRNTEASVQPSRDHKTKVTDEIQKLKYKEPTSTKLVQLEQELVRAEAENLVAEAQLSNVTRQKLKEAFASNFAAVIERSEKQAIIARHARRMLNLLDDTPVVPGDTRPSYEHERDAREILSQCEDELRNWRLEVEDVTSNAELGANLMPSHSPEELYHQPETGNGGRRVVSTSSTSSNEYVPVSGEAPGHQHTIRGRDHVNAPGEDDSHAAVPQAVPAS